MKYLSLLLLIALAACKGDSVPPDTVTGLVVDIPLDGSALERVSGTAGHMHHILTVDDRHGNSNAAMLFTRSDSSYIDFGDIDSASFDSVFTICCWVKAGDTSNPIAVLSKRTYTGPWEYSIDNHFNHSAFVMDNWVSSGGGSVYGTDPLKAEAAITPGVWQHIAYVADGNSLMIYLNGELQSGADLRNTGLLLSNTTGALVIGDGGGYGKHYYFDGAVDEIRMYNYALPAATIKYLSQN